MDKLLSKLSLRSELSSSRRFQGPLLVIFTTVGTLSVYFDGPSGKDTTSSGDRVNHRPHPETR